MKQNYILYGVLVLVIITLIFSVTGLPKIVKESDTKNKVPEDTADEQSFKSISTGDTGPGGVSVEITPLGISNGKLEAEISVNTHSVSLTQFNLKEITILEYGTKSVKPVAAPSLSGHHSNGILIFDVDDEISKFTIRIKGIPKVEKRVFSWP